MTKFPTYYPTSKLNKQEKPINFIYRLNYLKKIDDLFKKSQIVSLSNFGGVGKTTLALEFCKNQTTKDKASYIRWFDSKHFKTEYKQFAQLLEIEINDKDDQYIIDNINKKLKQYTKNIYFIFDNLEKFDLINDCIKCLPKNVKILITTRNQSTSNQINQISKINVEPFNLSESVDYIKNNLKITFNDYIISTILEIAKSSENCILPIKLEKIVSYINSYCVREIENLLNMLLKNHYIGDEIEVTLFLQLKLDEDGSLEMLQYFSFLNPDFIPTGIVNEISKKKNILVEVLIDKLVSFSLVNIITKNNKKV